MRDFSISEFRKTAGQLDLECYETISKLDKAIVFFIHGMADHAKRHFKLGEHLVANGFGFSTMDLPGHGKSAGNIKNLGNWPESGFVRINEFIDSRINELKDKYNKPIILTGHSMGSFAAIRYMQKAGDNLAGCIISGPIAQPTPSTMIMGKFVSASLCRISGPDSKSKFLNELSFGAFNKKFRPNRTDFDWLSSDESTVDDYVEDIHSGIICSSAYFYDLAKGLGIVYSNKELEKIPAFLPIMIFAGSEDPVSDMGKWVMKLRDKLAETNHKDVTIRIYEDYRHECMNEKNNEKVFEDIICFCNSALKKE